MSDQPTSFYPKDAQEKNFAAARELSVANAAKDEASRNAGYQDEDYVVNAKGMEVVNPAEPPYGDAKDLASAEPAKKK